MTSSQATRPNDDLSGGTVRRKSSTMSKGAALGLGVLLLIVGIGAGYAITKYAMPNSTGGAKTTTISETGSSLIYPYLQVLSPAFTAVYPNIALSPASTGSGTGISSAEAGTVDMGGTDAYLIPSTATSHNLVNFPIAISSQLVVYNLPGISSHLNLNGSVLAMIYQGAITHWNDPLIQAANPGVTLPSNAIVPIHRADGSGDTFMFSSLCFLSWKGWGQNYGTTITWPVGPSATGNSGMVTLLGNTQYGVAYIGISYLTQINATAGLAYAALGDQNANVNGVVGSGGAGQQNYILPSAYTVSQDANLGLQNLQPPSVA
ncbi:MAG: phosphate ABC transporter substrate-binding protein PstS, partial [Euryarchaeota archaeon]|nr:phosphate ABC transporter substrate-binding protein PstS [Euryarchaeota archaeon]